MERKVSVRRRRKKNWTDKCKDYFRSFLAFIFSNVGIVGLVVGYTIAGAAIFRVIEKGTDKEIREQVQNSRTDLAFNIWYISKTINILDKDQWEAYVNSELLKYEETVTKATRSGYDFVADSAENVKWNYPNAFLYALTVITTIGYGNIVPKSPMGKVVTIIYAIIGMPLFLLYLSNIGDIMARSFKWLYAKLCLCRCCPGVARKREERQRRRLTQLSVEYYGNHDGSESPEVNIRENIENGHREIEDDEGSEHPTEITEFSDDSQTVAVPITICLAIMVGYILGGALLFSQYENWKTLDGSYFCFISLSTIGFGDLVPGKAVYSGNEFQLSSIFGSMYLMLGMALIAMCFNLMQEEVINKIRKAVRTIKYIFRCNR